MLTMLRPGRCKFAYMTRLLESTGERIKRCRREAGLTQQQLADVAGVTAAAVAQWESGDSKTVRPENLFKVARALNKSAEWLITGAGEQYMKPDLHEIVNALPDDSQQQVFDFIEYRIDKAEGLLASDKAAEYTAMIEEFKRDLETRRRRDSADRDNSGKRSG